MIYFFSFIYIHILTYDCEVPLFLLGVEGRLALGDLAHVQPGGVQRHLLQDQLVHPHLQELKEKEEEDAISKRKVGVGGGAGGGKSWHFITLVPPE